MSSSAPRILVYCHNVHGLGHVVRSLRVAAELGPGERCACRLITGCRFLDHLDLDPRIEVVRLPALRPTAGGRLEPVDGGPLGPVLQERTRRIAAEVEGWRPHVALVDHNPLGLLGELTKALDASRKAAVPTRFVWGLRDIWGAAGYLDKMRPFRDLGSRLECYHGAIAYTDANWLDTFGEHPGVALPPHRRSVGFVTGPVPAPSVAGAGGAAGEPPLIAALSGGGAQAGDLLDLLLEAAGDALEAGELRLRFVIGPFTPEEPLRERAGGRRGIDLWPEGSVEEAVEGASLVVSRVGYNTAYTLVRTGLPVVFVPIQAENGEQALRAARLAELDGVWSVDETAGELAPALRDAIRRGLAGTPVARRLPFAVDGARRAADWLLELAEEVRA
jgi:predicted glycosyltransferase